MDVSGEFVSRDEFHRLDRDVNGNGQPGIKQNLQLALDQLSAIRGAADERARIDKKRWNIQAIIIAALTLVVGLLGLLEANRQTHGSLLNLPQITVPHALEKVYANTERSGDPPAWVTYDYK